MEREGERPFPDGATAEADIAPRPAHRPTLYTDELGARICAHIADGDSIRKVCEKEDIPSKSTIFRWLMEREEFRRDYAIALRWRDISREDECVDIADDSSEDMQIVAEGNEAPRLELNRENILRSKLRIDTRMALLGRGRAKQYTPENDDFGDGMPAPPQSTEQPEKPQLALIENDPLHTALNAYATVLGSEKKT